MQLTQARIFAYVLFAAATLGAPSCTTQARAETGPRVELLGRVSVTGNQVSLSDLLPQTASNALRLEAADVSLGRAPQPGHERSFGRVDVERALTSHSGTFSSLSVPDRMTVSSAARAITTDEAFQAIRTQLRKSDISAAESLRAEDVQLGAQVFVRPGDAGLRVTRMDVDPILGRARFLLWPANDPEVIPFFAIVRLDASSRAQLLNFRSVNSQPADFPLANAKAARSARLAPETLVQPGQVTVLRLQNAKMQITLDVVPLERGSLGQKIRVRMSGSGKIVTAEVTGRARLEAQL